MTHFIFIHPSFLPDLIPQGGGVAAAPRPAVLDREQDLRGLVPKEPSVGLRLLRRLHSVGEVQVDEGYLHTIAAGGVSREQGGILHAKDGGERVAARGAAALTGKEAQEATVDLPYVAFAVRPNPGVWEFVRVSLEDHLLLLYKTI
ncbi:hypothetical protein GYH30_024863 [Glycine max]|nr:hypothetical protein GYH30_024863 [Glycine max]